MTAAEVGKQIEYLARALKAPRIREAAARLADQARDAGWTHEEYSARGACEQKPRPYRSWTDTMNDALEARSQRLCHHFRQPLAPAETY